VRAPDSLYGAGVELTHPPQDLLPLNKKRTKAPSTAKTETTIMESIFKDKMTHTGTKKSMCISTAPQPSFIAHHMSIVLHANQEYPIIRQ
jgi:hypothetical protein